MIRYFLFFFITLSALSQKNDTALLRFPNLELPLVIDDLTFNNVMNSKSLSYKELSHLLVSDDKEFEIKLNDTASNKLYSLGKFYNDGKLNLIILHHFKNDKEERILVYLLNYYSNTKLSGYDIIAWRIKNNSKTTKKVCLLNASSIISFRPKNDINAEANYYKYNSQKRFPYDIYDCEKLQVCTSYCPKLDSLPDRKENFWNFDKTFFKSKIDLVPYKYCSIDTTTQVLSSIEEESKVSMKNYFLDSKKLKDGKVIVFFLNDYNYRNYEIVKEIGYQIFNKNGTLSKQKQIALYHLDNRGVESSFLSKVFVDGDKLKIESGYLNFEKEKETLDLL
ncbi:hypothetical protein ASE21_01180 [Flavobacterium sp. Root901]|uniref:hypothetical protein n=1 Tax=Flavobacterium sp. Root901 TaxID=1736605 RepID=UPI00070F2A9E|nr:hypothetical protein [Flavobacterium sp. Root901]KRD12551.1 hypothetical protein ASE21_01180 [Flavobacterium sp. Root901]